METKLNPWKEANKQLIVRMENWRESYSCKHNCLEWQKWKFCAHLRRTRAKVFAKEIHGQIKELMNLKTNQVALEPSQSSIIA